MSILAKPRRISLLHAHRQNLGASWARVESKVARHMVLLITTCALMICAACSTAVPPSSTVVDGRRPATVVTAVSSEQQSMSGSAVEPDLQILNKLWQVRSTKNQENSELVLGPGDILKISLPQLDHLKDDRVRVSEDSTINLPLLGVIKVSQMNQSQLRRTLMMKMEKYVYKPQVEVSLVQSENSLVAVLGAVKNPGRYSLAKSSDTLMTMISRAGGTTGDAGSRVIFIPAPDDDSANVVEGMNLAPASTLAAARAEGSADGAERAEAAAGRALAEGAVIDLSHPANQQYLALPAKSGDVIIVPAAGQVTVQGWVDKPGAFPITPQMTVLGAIAAAGGALFTSSATLLRDQGTGGKLVIPLDLTRIKRGAEPDVALQGGDVVIVNRSVAGALPYSLYFLVNHTGFGLPVLPF